MMGGNDKPSPLVWCNFADGRWHWWGWPFEFIV